MSVVPEETKQKIREFIDIVEELDAIAKNTKNMRQRKKVLEQEIKEDMINNDIPELDIGKSGALSVVYKAPIKKVDKNNLFDFLLESGISEPQRDDIIGTLFPVQEEVAKLCVKKPKK